jgi:RNA-directed DNA polymerase
MTKLRVEINEEKSRKVDLSTGGSFGFLGFEYRRIRSRQRKWRAQYEPKLKKGTAPLQKLKDEELKVSDSSAWAALGAGAGL